MTKQDIWDLFYGVDTAMRGRNIVAVLVAAMIIGAVIFITYRVTHLSTAYSAKINATNVAVTLITAVIMLMISWQRQPHNEQTCQQSHNQFLPHTLFSSFPI